MVRDTDLKGRKKSSLKRIYCCGMIVLLFLTLYPFLTAQEKVMAIKGGKIQTVTKGVIENGIILIRNQKIVEIGPQVDIPADAEVFDFQDKFIMPGVVSPDSNVGIFKQAEVYPIQDTSGKNLAYYPVLYSVYPEDPDYLMALRHGFTTLGLSPPPVGISGLGAVIKPFGENLKEVLIKDKAFLKITVFINTPFWNMMKRSLDDAKKKLEEQKKKQEEKKKDKGKKKKEEEEEEKEEETISETTKVFMEVLEGKLKIFAECQTPAAISHLLELLSGYPKVKVVIRGGPETYRAGSLLKKKNIPVILVPSILTRLRWSIAERTNYILKCQELGLKLAFQAPGDVQDQIQLFHFLNRLFQYGVKKDVLLKGVTIIPAELLGVNKFLGSLEKGKRADMIIFKDDPIENIPVIEKVVLGGKFVK